MHDNSLLLFRKYAGPIFAPGIRVLEIGGSLAGSLYRSAIADDSITWETLDLKPRGGVVHVAQGEYSYPFSDGEFDVVFAGQVLEHVRHPWMWMREASRITKRGGYVITISPVSWPYHEAPVDCWRIYPEGMRALAEYAALDVFLCKCESIESDAYARFRFGRGRVSTSKRSFYKYCVLRGLSYLGWPAEVSLDTIMIARKPVANSPA